MKRFRNVSETPPETETETDIKTHPSDESPETASAISAPTPSGAAKAAKIAPCPYREILNLWRTILPELTQPHDVEHWTDARKAQIRARWNDQLPDLEAWSDTFELVRKSPFLMGKEHSNGRKPFKCDLFWVTKPENLLRIYEGKYNG